MKKITKTILIAISLVFGFSQAHAWDSGDQCGLVESWGSDQLKVVRSLDLRKEHNLTELQSWQLIRAAHYLVVEPRYNFPVVVDSPQKAIDLLRNHSSGRELYMHFARFSGVIHTVVSFYPGDNHSGAIFKGTKIVGEIGDDDIACVYED